MEQKYTVRNAKPDEFESIGEFTNKPDTELLVAVSPQNKIAGAVIYVGDMKYYGSGGIAPQEQKTSGFRLLAVDTSTRGSGIGKLLTKTCIQKAKHRNSGQVIIHTTLAMQIAWKMYEKLGFKRSDDLDFMQGDLAVFGFRLKL